MRILLWVVGVLALALPARAEPTRAAQSQAQSQAQKATAKRTVDPGKQAIEAARKKAAAAKKKAAVGPAGKAKGPGAGKADGNSDFGSAARRALLSKAGAKAKAKGKDDKAKKPVRAKS